MTNSEKIVWSKDYFLQWSDYLAEQNPAEFHPAKTIIQYNATWEINWYDKEGKISYSINKIQLVPAFQKNISWVRHQEMQDDTQKQLILKHEQGHFDLAEKLRIIITEKVQNTFTEKFFPVFGKNDEHAKDFVLKDSKERVQEELEKQTNEIFKKQEQIYDNETGYGFNKEKQQEFDDIFAKLRE